MSIKLSFFIGTLVLVAIFISTFKTALDTRNDRNNLATPNRARIEADHVRPGNSSSNLFYFIHVSDVHLSVHFDKNRLNDFENFCQELLPHVLRAPLLVLTGDITDSRTKDPMGSGAYLQEWQDYRRLHSTCMKHNPQLVWLDIRGNHDNFNVLGTENAYYKNYTVQGKMTKDGTSYRYEHRTPDGGRYTFLGIDACLKPGIRRPFNFIGEFYPDEVSKIEKLKRESLGTNYTIWFGHYPTSSIINADDVRPMINGPYLCGHYHNLHGLVNQMISTQPDGYLEAEVADWKDSRIFRIAAVDHGMFTFEDFSYKRDREGPWVVVTNPRKVIYQMEHIEPYWRTAQSTHIRALVFSKNTITNVKVYITSDPKVNEKTTLYTSEMKHADGQLWVAPWNASHYTKGIYYVTVEATDNHHSTKRVTNAFSLDQSKPEFTFLGRVLLRVPFQYFGLFMFTICLFLSVTPLVGFRLFTENTYTYNRHMFNLSRRCFSRKFMFKFYLLAHIKKMSYLMIFIPIYISLGPWVMGHYVIDRLGLSFMWGTIVNGRYLPVGFTYVFAFVIMFSFHIPFLFGLSELVHNRYLNALKLKQESQQPKNKNANKTNGSKCLGACNYFLLLKVFVIVIAILFAIASVVFYFAYGYLALVFNAFTWTSVAYFALIIMGVRLDQRHFPLSKTSRSDGGPSSARLLDANAEQ